MKKKFSTSWIGSSQPRKQRKYRANAPLHLRRKFVSVALSKPLRKTQGKRNVVLKKNDKVKIMRGKFKGKTGKVLSVDLKYSKVIVENIQVTKLDGSKANVKLQPSNLQIIEMADRKPVKKNEKKETKEVKKVEKKTESKKKSASGKGSELKENKK
jgi:large subunit ribosomal protein L24